MVCIPTDIVRQFGALKSEIAQMKQTLLTAAMAATVMVTAQVA